MKTTRFIVFPVEGRRWSFTTGTFTRPPTGTGQANDPTFKELWRSISITPSADQGLSRKAELITDFVSHKMQQKWLALEKAPVGSIRQRVYSLGQWLLDRVKPSEMFLKSISKDTTKVEVVFPLSLNPRLVRRRLRCIANSGAIYHRRYMYGSIALLPFTALFAVVPLPNVPLFWNLFRAHAHWRALQGSERLLLLVSDCSNSWSRIGAPHDMNRETENASQGGSNTAGTCPWVLIPCRELENIVVSEAKTGALSNSTISIICKTYNLDSSQVMKWRDDKL
uniref:Uncharacterized protein n=1 Tax=Picea sitchensis TaxID=3332 RepID=D5A8R7_PICSI|nr:unknown [Picea sitchensis]